MQLLAQRGANTPFVGTGVPTVSFSALSSNAIYSMIISYGGGGGGFTGNPNQFSVSGGATNIIDGVPLTNLTAWVGIDLKASVDGDDVLLTPSTGGVLTFQSGSDPWGTAVTMNNNGITAAGFFGSGRGLTDFAGFNTNIAGAGMISNSMPVVQFNGTVSIQTNQIQTDLGVGGVARFTNSAYFFGTNYVGPAIFTEDGGLQSGFKMSVTAGASAGTLEGYTFELDGTPVATVQGQSDQNNGVTNLQFIIGGSLIVTNGVRQPTNGVVGTLLAGKSYSSNLTAAVTFTAIGGVPWDTTWRTEFWWKNTSGSDQPITFPNGVVGQSNSFPAVVTATNNTRGICILNGYGQSATNLETKFFW